MSLPYLVYILAILGLEVLLVGLIWLWWRTLKQQQETFNQATQGTYTELTRIVEKTSHEAERVMAEALKTAAHLQQTAHRHAEQLEQQTEDLVTKQNQWHERTLQDLMTRYQTDISTETHKNILLVQQLMEQRLSTIDTAITQDLQQTSTEMRAVVRQKIEASTAAIEAHQAGQIKIIEAQSQAIVQRVTRDLLGKTLTPADHHQLVSQQLTQALRQDSP